MQPIIDTFSERELKLQDKIGWHPHENQIKVLKDRKRFTVICAGTRFGKSQLCAYIALKKLLNPKTHTWIVSPTYDLSKKVFEHLNEFLGCAFPEDIQRGRIKISRIAGKLSVRIPRLNSWVECKSAEFPAGLLGEELDLVIMDECSRMREDIWDSYISGRLTSRRGEAMFISTPFGKNWFWKLHTFFSTQDDGRSFHFSSQDNPYFPLDEWERERRTKPEHVFKQEYMALFLDDAASVFRGIARILNGEPKEPKRGHSYSIGVDLGKYADFTVISVIDKMTHNLDFFDRFNKIDWNLQKARIYEIAKRYKGRITIDSTGVGDPITEDLRKMGLPVDDFKYSNTKKAQLIEKLSIFIEQGRIAIQPIEVLRNELESFGFSRTPSGKTKYSAPEGMHDDCVNSLALAVWPLREKPFRPEENSQIVFTHARY